MMDFGSPIDQCSEELLIDGFDEDFDFILGGVDGKDEVSDDGLDGSWKVTLLVDQIC